MTPDPGLTYLENMIFGQKGFKRGNHLSLGEVQSAFLW